MGCQCSQSSQNQEACVDQEEAIHEDNPIVQNSEEKNETSDDKQENKKEKEQVIPSVVTGPDENRKDQNNGNDEPTTDVANNIQPESKQKNTKINVENYSKDAFNFINEIRANPKKYIEDIKSAISLIKYEKDKIIYSGRLKVALNKGEESFQETIRILEETGPLPPFEFDTDIAITVPQSEAEMKDPSFFQNKLIEKKKETKIDAYFKDAVKDAYISTLLILIDDSGKLSGKKEILFEAVLIKDSRFLRLTSINYLLLITRFHLNKQFKMSYTINEYYSKSNYIKVRFFMY